MRETAAPVKLVLRAIWVLETGALLAISSSTAPRFLRRKSAVEPDPIPSCSLII
jgi:hypothetical protein